METTGVLEVLDYHDLVPENKWKKKRSKIYTAIYITGSLALIAIQICIAVSFSSFPYEGKKNVIPNQPLRQQPFLVNSLHHISKATYIFFSSSQHNLRAGVQKTQTAVWTMQLIFSRCRFVFVCPSVSAQHPTAPRSLARDIGLT